MSFTMSRIKGREILDSRGNPTLEVEVWLEDGTKARAGVPSGASTGSREVVELRDGDASRYGGKGVLLAVSHVNNVLASTLTGVDCRDQVGIDHLIRDLDGTETKARLGGNALLGVSMAVAKVAAKASRLPLYRYLGGAVSQRLPVPMMNILNGGVHARGQGADIQEFMIAPYGAPSFSEALRFGSEIYHALQSLLLERSMSTGVGDEGGFAPIVSSNRQPLDLIMEAIHQVGLKAGEDVGIAMDPASTEFYRGGQYHLRAENKALSPEQMVDYYSDLVRDYPLCLLEDGLAEDDWAGWRLLTERLGEQIELVGDDIFCTNPKTISRAIFEQVGNAALIKLNQIGTVSEAIEAARLAKSHGWGAFVSHRSGETVDSFVADLTVALDAGHLKTGAPCRGERVEKYNQLLRIEEDLGREAIYAGKAAFCRPVRF